MQHEHWCRVGCAAVVVLNRLRQGWVRRWIPSVLVSASLRLGFLAYLRLLWLNPCRQADMVVVEVDLHGTSLLVITAA